MTGADRSGQASDDLGRLAELRERWGQAWLQATSRSSDAS